MRYEFRVRGHLDQHWSDWLDGLTIGHDADGTTYLLGDVPDQAALHGVIARLRDIGAELIAVFPAAPPIVTRYDDHAGA